MLSRGKRLLQLSLEKAQQKKVSRKEEDLYTSGNSDLNDISSEELDDSLDDPDYHPEVMQDSHDDTFEETDRVSDVAQVHFEGTIAESDNISEAVQADHEQATTEVMHTDHEQAITEVMQAEHEQATTGVKQDDPEETLAKVRKVGNEKSTAETNNISEVTQVDHEEAVPEAMQVDHEEIIAETVTGLNKRKGDPTLWKKNVQKQMRMEGKKYLGTKKSKADGKWDYCVERGERIITPRGCSKRCDKSSSKGCSKFSEEERRNLFTSFWENMNWDEKKVYCNSLVEVRTVGRRTSEGESRRNVSYRYFLRKSQERVCVCKNMFLSTLGVGERTVYEWIKNTKSGIPDKPNKSSKKSEARRERDHELRESVTQYLAQLPKMESHYCRASTSKIYLEPVFGNFSELFNAYTDYCKIHDLKSASYSLFKIIFNDMNLGIFSPKKDQCDICCGFNTGNVTNEDYNAHINRKEAARREKKKDKEQCETDQTYKVVTIDLQSVLLCPRLQASALYYKTKLTCYNYTVYDLKTKDVACYFWNETESDLSANSFASCISHYIENSLADDGIKNVVLYSDGCCYQNRNVTLSNALLKIAKTQNITITQKFLEKGHTQMEVDSVHSMIERKMKHKPIYVPQNYVDIIKQTRPKQPYKVHYVKNSFFKKYTDLQYYSSIRPGVRVGEPVVTDIRVLHYSPDGIITYKINYEDDLQELPRKAKCSKVQENEGQLNNMHSGRLAIKASKFAHLQQLKSVMPEDYHSFYDTLKYDS